MLFPLIFLKLLLALQQLGKKFRIFAAHYLRKKWCKLAVLRFAKTGYPSDGYFFASLFACLLNECKYKNFPANGGYLWLFFNII